MTDEIKNVLNEELADIVEAIRQKRREKKLSQVELARRAKLHPTQISSFETGKVLPTIENVFRLAEGVGARIELSISFTDEA